jgi:catechol 2,3-dioxygenase-like lactoylglutathione lyase family enzyme
MHINQLDHLVLTVRSIEAACDFYARVLGMTVVTFANSRKALQFGTQKINLHEAGKEFEPKTQHPTPGSADLCFITTVPLQAVVAHVQACGVTIIDGPVPHTGAVGEMESIYLRNPDGNLIEISNYLA